MEIRVHDAGVLYAFGKADEVSAVLEIIPANPAEHDALAELLHERQVSARASIVPMHRGDLLQLRLCVAPLPPEITEDLPIEERIMAKRAKLRELGRELGQLMEEHWQATKHAARSVRA